MTSLLRPVTALALSATVLTGCLPGGDDETADGTSQSTGVTEASGALTGNPEDGAKQAGIDLENPPAPIAETTVKISAGQDVEATKVELLELKRHENVMLATFRLTGEGRGSETKSAFSLMGNTGFRPVFIDMKNLEKYRHVDDLATDVTAARAPLGDPVYVFTAFPLPREGVTAMDLQVSGGSPVIPDVPMPQ